MIIEILELAAALEWIALGVLVFFKLRSLKSRIDALLDEMWPKSPATLRDETPIGPGPDPAGKKARGQSARNVGLWAAAAGTKRQIRVRVRRAGTQKKGLPVERMAGISGHALSGQKTCRGGRLCPPGRKRCG